MGVRFLKIAVVYLIIGVSLGFVMGMTHRFTLAPVHAHLNLLGWASLALAGLIYHLYPAAAQTRLAHIHFWMHNIGLPILMVALGFMLSGNEAFDPLVGVGATISAVGVIVFAVNVLLNVRSGQAAGTMPVAKVARAA